MELEPIIGLEIHLQLKTKSKMFCSCDNSGENKSPNTTVCPICLGHPGTLPVPNAAAIEIGVKAALSLNFNINLNSKFDRKNYFYPDLPKGYQISQYDEPLASNGYLEIETSAGLKKIDLERLHLEEDTAKLIHQNKKSLIDFNRAGIPLLEIVTTPSIKTPEEARIFLQELRLIMRYIGASDADMEKGHLRCDANISLRPKGDNNLYSKTEIKNLNSFRSVEKALKYEIKRQSELWHNGQPVSVTNTRGWDELRGETIAQREKEAENDYRYFPEPDIHFLRLTQEQVDMWREELPELPAARRRRWQSSYDLKPADARLLTEDKQLGDYTERVIIELAGELDGSVGATAKLAVNWIVNKLTEVLADKKISLNELPFGVSDFVQFLLMVARRQVNSTNAQVLLRKMVESGQPPFEIIKNEDLSQLENSFNVEDEVGKVINLHLTQAEELRRGKTVLIKYFVGLVMKNTKGKINPVLIEEEIKKQAGIS